MSGVGLPELLVSLLLSSVITLELMQHYLSFKKQYIYLQKEVELGIDMQFITNLIRGQYP